MSHRIATIVLFFIPFFLSAQSGKNRISIHGVVKNQQRPFFLLNITGITDTVKTNKDGGFDLTLESKEAVPLTFDFGRQKLELFAMPGDQLDIQLSATNVLDATFTGKSAAYCLHLTDRARADLGVEAKKPAQLSYAMPAASFYAYRDSIRQNRISALNACHQPQGVDRQYHERFIQIQSSSIQYQMALELLLYKSQAMKSGVSFFPSEYDTYIHALDLNDESVAFDRYYKSYAMNLVSSKASQLYMVGADKSATEFYRLVFAELCANIQSDKNKSILIAELAPNMLRDIGVGDLRPVIQQIESCCSDKKLLESFRQVAAQFASLYPGADAPNAEFHDLNNVVYHISDFKGKVIYIDTWATWCGPCKAEIPALQKLEEEYHDKNIQFISISTDQSMQNWIDFLKKQPMGGLQAHNTQNTSASISALYKVNSIPRFILINQDGKIVTANAPRPSSGEEIRALLNRILNN